MSKLTIITSDGRTHVIEVPPGMSAMQAALSAGIGEVLGECGGSMMCATCHVYVNDSWLARLPPMSSIEDAMLDSTAAERRLHSRLSCQLAMAEDLDGLILHLPDRQT